MWLGGAGGGRWGVACGRAGGGAACLLALMSQSTPTKTHMSWPLPAHTLVRAVCREHRTATPCITTQHVGSRGQVDLARTLCGFAPDANLAVQCTAKAYEQVALARTSVASTKVTKSMPRGGWIPMSSGDTSGSTYLPGSTYGLCAQCAALEPGS